MDEGGGRREREEKAKMEVHKKTNRFVFLRNSSAFALL